MIHTMTTIFLYLLFASALRGGVCLVVASVFVGVVIIVVRTAWIKGGEESEPDEYEPLRREK